MTDPNNTTEIVNVIPRETEFGAGIGAFALTHAAQQAVLPRKLVDGELYAVLNKGRIELVETPGFTDRHEEERAWKPRQVRRAVTVVDPESLLAFLAANTTDVTPGDPAIYDPEEVQLYSRHGDGELEVWADLDTRTITAYTDGGHGWRKHSATLRLDHSREWREWTAIDGRLLPQVQFAQFIEDHISSIGEPDGAKLLDICQTLQAATSVTFKQQQILANGERQFRYEETIAAKAGQRGDLTIPGELMLVLRPFTGSEPVAITARFRYRLTDGALTLGVRLAEPERAIEAAFNDTVQAVDEGVPTPVLYGRP